jgi:hypothetical protein
MPLRGALLVRTTATPTATRPVGRLVQHLRDELLSSQAVDRLRRELEDELEAVSSSEHAAEDDARRDALERAVRRIWGAPL